MILDRDVNYEIIKGHGTTIKLVSTGYAVELFSLSLLARHIVSTGGNSAAFLHTSHSQVIRVPIFPYATNSEKLKFPSLNVPHDKDLDLLAFFTVYERERISYFSKIFSENMNFKSNPSDF